MRYLKVDNYIVTTPIIDILKRLQLSLTNGKLRDIKEGGDNLVVTCPNDSHAGGRETKPACNIYVGNDPEIEYGLARCFVCGYTAPFVDFVAKCFGYSTEFAKNWLIKNFGVLAEDKFIVGDDIILNKKQQKNFIDDSILEQYQSWCPYLEQRKLTKETCEKFEVKYDSKHRQVLFPCRDIHNHLVMIPKRSIDTKVFYLDKNQEKPVYLLNYIMENNYKRVIITEGPFDALTGNQYNVPTIATFGTPSDEQINQINKSCIRFLYTMFDNDDAGRRFAKIIKDKISPHIIVTELKIPDPYKDINDLDFDTFWTIIESAENI